MESPEYCTLMFNWPCLTQTEWAAWVQGVGTVLAVVAAVVIAWWQHHVAKQAQDAIERRHQEELERQRRFRARAIALEVVPLLNDYIVNLRMIKRATDQLPIRMAPSDIARQIYPDAALRSFIAQSDQLGAAARHFQDTLLFATNVHGLANAYSNLGNIDRTEEHTHEYEREIPAAVNNALTEAVRARDAISEIFGQDRR